MIAAALRHARATVYDDHVGSGCLVVGVSSTYARSCRWRLASLPVFDGGAP